MLYQNTAHCTDWVAAINALMAPHLHQISYGNLRSEFSTWQEDEGTVTNLAIVYEVPGGSTNQINVTYFGSSQAFMYLALDSHEECCTTDLQEVMQMIADAVERIPAIRKHRLIEDIDRWTAQGLSQRDLFQKMNNLLQIEDLRGGTITMIEMKFGIAHILKGTRAATA